MAQKADFEDLLEDAPESQAFDADEEPVFSPTPDKDDGVVIVEPKIISIGRDKRKREMRKMQQESSDN